MNNFDCRTISGNGICEHLYIWRREQHIEYARTCTCKALNVTIFPEYINDGKVNQELKRIKPVFECPILQELRVKGHAPKVMGSIENNKLTSYND